MATKTILWVEGDKEVIQAFESRFRSQGWQLVWACSAHEGKALAGQIKPDLTIVDVTMAGEQGYAAIRDFKSARGLEDVPIIVLNGIRRRPGESEASRRDDLPGDIDEFVDKSGGPDVLLSAVRRCLRTQAV